MNWTDNKRWGPPDEEGWYLVAFSDGKIETFPWYEGDEEWWIKPYKGAKGEVIITHWAELPEHPALAKHEKP